MFTYLIWKEKYYSKKDYDTYNFCHNYSYNFRLFMCILFTIFAVPLDLISLPIQLVLWLGITFDNM